MVKEPKFNDHLRHIELQYHFVKDKFDKDEIELFYISLEDLLVDSLTKDLTAKSSTKHVMSMGMK